MSFSAQLKYTASADERGAERFRLLLPASAEKPGSDLFDIIVHDLSTGGLLVETQAPLSIGSEILLDIPGAGSVAAEVAWNSDDFFGGQFHKPLSPSAVTAAFAASRVVWPNFTSGSSADRAQAPTGQPHLAPAEIARTGAPDRSRHPLHVRLKIIIGASLLLWTPIAAALWVALA
jgi:hypothetical protein